jgi:hypothetical protein
MAPTAARVVRRWHMVSCASPVDRLAKGNLGLALAVRSSYMGRGTASSTKNSAHTKVVMGELPGSETRSVGVSSGKCRGWDAVGVGANES